MKNSVLLFAVICIVGVYSLTDEEKQKIRAEVRECVVKSGVDEKIFEDIKAGKDVGPNRELDCFSACVLKKNGVMKEDGTANHKVTDSEKVTNCKNQSGKDDCETAGKIMSCYHENGLLPKF